MTCRTPCPWCALGASDHDEELLELQQRVIAVRTNFEQGLTCWSAVKMAEAAMEWIEQRKNVAQANRMHKASFIPPCPDKPPQPQQQQQSWGGWQPSTTGNLEQKGPPKPPQPQRQQEQQPQQQEQKYLSGWVTANRSWVSDAEYQQQQLQQQQQPQVPPQPQQLQQQQQPQLQPQPQQPAAGRLQPWQPTPSGRPPPAYCKADWFRAGKFGMQYKWKGKWASYDEITVAHIKHFLDKVHTEVAFNIGETSYVFDAYKLAQTSSGDSERALRFVDPGGYPIKFDLEVVG